jgi:hypothetical protein
MMMMPNGGDPGPMPFNVPQLQAANLPQFKRPAGMFGGSAFQGIAGAIGDYLLQRAGAQAVYAPNMAARRRQAYEESQYQRHRTDALTDYEAKQKIDQQYPTTPAPTEYERALQASGIKPGTPEWAQHMGSFVNMRENPPFTYVDPSTGAVMMGARSQPQILDALPPGARPIGGPTPSASGGFPGY